MFRKKITPTTSFYFLQNLLQMLLLWPVFELASGSKVDGPDSSLMRKYRLMRRIGKIRKAVKMVEVNAQKEKRRAEKKWEKYRRRRKMRWAIRGFFKRKKRNSSKDKSDSERKNALAEESRWRKEQRHWNIVRRRRIIRLVIRNLFSEKKSAPKRTRQVVEPIEIPVDEPLFVLTKEDVVDASEIRRMEREERKWQRYKRRRIAKYIVKKSFKKLFEKKSEEQKQESKLLRQIRRDISRFERKKRRRLLRYVVNKRVVAFKRYFKNFPAEPIKQMNKYFYDARIGRDQFIVISINSTVYFVLSYIALYVFKQLVTSVFALHFDFQTVLYYYETYFNVAVESWSFDSVKILYSVPNLTSLVVGLLFAVLYTKIRYERGHLKMFVVWTMFHCFTQFASDILFGPILEQGIGYVMMYLYFLDTKRMVMVIIGLFLLLTSGAMLAKSFMLTANTYVTELTQHNRKLFMIGQVLIPYFVGSAIVIGLKMPEITFYEIALMSGGILVVIPIMVTYSTYNELYFDYEPRRIRFFVRVIITAVIFILAWRIITEFGLRIGSNNADIMLY